MQIWQLWSGHIWCISPSRWDDFNVAGNIGQTDDLLPVTVRSGNKNHGAPRNTIMRWGVLCMILNFEKSNHVKYPHKKVNIMYKFQHQYLAWRVGLIRPRSQVHARMHTDNGMYSLRDTNHKSVQTYAIHITIWKTKGVVPRSPLQNGKQRKDHY